MEYLKNFWNNFVIWFLIFCKILPDLFFKISGNLFPFYIGWVILKIFKPSDVNAVFEPASFVLYASTFLFSSFYLWYKTGKKGLIFLLFLITLAVVISLLYAYSIINRDNNNFSFESYLIFWVSIFIYVIYECISEKVSNNNFGENTKEQYNSLVDRFLKSKK